MDSVINPLYNWALYFCHARIYAKKLYGFNLPLEKCEIFFNILSD